jgi:hypothetical protein
MQKNWRPGTAFVSRDIKYKGHNLQDNHAELSHI